MLKDKKIKIIIDTNLFISFLIGKQLKKLKDNIVNNDIILIFSEQNILELKIVSQRPKFSKYFSEKNVNDLIDFIRLIGKVYLIDNITKICRDPKDDFLLSLAAKSDASFLVTGDKDLLVLKNYKNTKIVTVKEFEYFIK